MNLVELDRALRQLRLSGMAAVLETRLRQAQTEKARAHRSRRRRSSSDELLRRQDRLLERRHKQARFRDPDRSLDTLRFRFQQEDESRADPRAGDRPLHRAARRRALSRPTRAPGKVIWPKPSAAP